MCSEGGSLGPRLVGFDKLQILGGLVSWLAGAGSGRVGLGLFGFAHGSFIASLFLDVFSCLFHSVLGVITYDVGDRWN